MGESRLDVGGVGGKMNEVYHLLAPPFWEDETRCCRPHRLPPFRKERERVGQPLQWCCKDGPAPSRLPTKLIMSTSMRLKFHSSAARAISAQPCAASLRPRL